MEGETWGQREESQSPAGCTLYCQSQYSLSVHKPRSTQAPKTSARTHFLQAFILAFHLECRVVVLAGATLLLEFDCLFSVFYQLGYFMACLC